MWVWVLLVLDLYILLSKVLKWVSIFQSDSVSWCETWLIICWREQPLMTPETNYSLPLTRNKTRWCHSPGADDQMWKSKTISLDADSFCRPSTANSAESFSLKLVTGWSYYAWKVGTWVMEGFPVQCVFVNVSDLHRVPCRSQGNSFIFS